MLSLGLASSFFSVGAWLNSSAGSTLSHLLYFPVTHTGTSGIPRHTYRAHDPRTGGSEQGLPCSGVGQLWAGLRARHRSWRADCAGRVTPPPRPLQPLSAPSPAQRLASPDKRAADPRGPQCPQALSCALLPASPLEARGAGDLDDPGRGRTVLRPSTREEQTL